MSKLELVSMFLISLSPVGGLGEGPPPVLEHSLVNFLFISLSCF